MTTRPASCFILFLSVSACVDLPANGGAQSGSPPVLVELGHIVVVMSAGGSRGSSGAAELVYCSHERNDLVPTDET